MRQGKAVRLLAKRIAEAGGAKGEQAAEKFQEPLADARGSETTVHIYSHLPSRDR
jgi:hypothetical protein